jgi:hypothetical protein
MGEELPPASIPAAIFRPFSSPKMDVKNPSIPGAVPSTLAPNGLRTSKSLLLVYRSRQVPAISSLVAGDAMPPERSSAVTASAMARSSAGVADAPRVLATDSRRERRSASASAVDVDASDDDEDEDADARRLDGARCEVYRAGLDTDADRRASRRYDGRGVCTELARDDTRVAMVRSSRTARVDVDNFEQRLRLKRTKK